MKKICGRNDPGTNNEKLRQKRLERYRYEIIKAADPSRDVLRHSGAVPPFLPQVAVLYDPDNSTQLWAMECSDELYGILITDTIRLPENVTKAVSLFNGEEATIVDGCITLTLEGDDANVFELF